MLRRNGGGAVSVAVTSAPEPSAREAQMLAFSRDAVLALAVVGLFVVLMVGYAQVWPPVVVIESGSMMHGDAIADYGTSRLGIIDTGDLVLVHKVQDQEDVIPYLDGYLQDHVSYGSYGDVIIFYKGGDTNLTPTIHRAVIYLTYDAANRTFAAPVLADLPYVPTDGGTLVAGVPYWGIVTTPAFSAPRVDACKPGANDAVQGMVPASRAPRVTALTGTLCLFNYGHLAGVRAIPLHALIAFNPNGAHSGFVTAGDNNPIIDQHSLGSAFELVDPEWVIGKARGEMPWVGLLKLEVMCFQDSDRPSCGEETFALGGITFIGPGNSWMILIPLILTVILGPFAYDFVRGWFDKDEEESAPGDDPSDGDDDSGDVPGSPVDGLEEAGSTPTTEKAEDSS